LALLLRFWQPKEIWRFPDEAPATEMASQPKSPTGHGRSGIRENSAPASQPTLSTGQIVYAWMPWIFLSVLVFLWGWPSVKTFLSGGPAEKPNLLAGFSKLAFPVAGLHNRIYR